MVLLIDNYDSFTYNLYQYLCELGSTVKVYRNDAITLKDIECLNPSHLVISPGPGNPDQAGISLAAIAHFSANLPILGVCLGHQAIGQVFGATVCRARQAVHGKSSLITHNQQGIFHDLKNPLNVVRYHSLLLDKHTLPPCFEITAWHQQEGEIEEIMAIRHRTLRLQGVQFHPESILTEQGHQLLANFLAHH